jgi:murein L,D-transpeptidase YafK
MKPRSQRWLAALLMVVAGWLAADAGPLGVRTLLAKTGVAPGRAAQAAARVEPRLREELRAAGLEFGAPVFLRIFKLESQLELWVRQSERYALFRTYPICTFSGELGPKLKVGDGQAPEGFYRVRAGQLNPFSSYHLSFDLGYPNAYDRAHGRTGSLLMVHGSCVSIGCYAMGDGNIEEIYTLVAAALAGGQDAVPVHALPFRFDRADVPARLQAGEWAEFWGELQAGWDAFEASQVPPSVTVVDGHYRIEPREG